MPVVQVRRPNRTFPRLLTPKDVARMYCFLVERGLYSRQDIQDEIDDKCPEDDDEDEDEKAAEASQAVADFQSGFLDQLNDVYERFKEVNKFIDSEQKETKRLLRIIDIIFEGVPLLQQVLRRIPLLSPVFAGLRRMRSTLRAREGKLAVERAANDEAIDILDNAQVEWNLYRRFLPRAA